VVEVEVERTQVGLVGSHLDLLQELLVQVVVEVEMKVAVQTVVQEL
jgi:prephenate dehydratase